MSKFDALIQDFVIVNRILAREEVVDAYGHVSVRHPDNPHRFLIARSSPRNWWAPKTSSNST
jgi:ribulose-5-phosphate 4-epimerase/fuculose-1-phosphate aldolase